MTFFKGVAPRLIVGEEAMKRAEESLSEIDHGENAEEAAALQAAISKSMAQLKLKRKRRQL